MRPSMISSQRAPVLQTYHELLRAIGFAFKGRNHSCRDMHRFELYVDPGLGDQAALTQARVAARQSFRKPHEEKQTLPQRIEHAQSVVKILYENVVQGSKNAADQDRPYSQHLV